MYYFISLVFLVYNLRVVILQQKTKEVNAINTKKDILKRCLLVFFFGFPVNFVNCVFSWPGTNWG